MSLPLANWQQEIQGHMQTMCCRHNRMPILEVMNASMNKTYCHQMACIKKDYRCNGCVGNKNIRWQAARVSGISNIPQRMECPNKHTHPSMHAHTV
jgi:hypothetical protein